MYNAKLRSLLLVSIRFVVIIQKMMPDAVLFICDHCVEIHIGNALEDICLDLRV